MNSASSAFIAIQVVKNTLIDDRNDAYVHRVRVPAVCKSANISWSTGSLGMRIQATMSQKITFPCTSGLVGQLNPSRILRQPGYGFTLWDLLFGGGWHNQAFIVHRLCSLTVPRRCHFSGCYVAILSKNSSISLWYNLPLLPDPGGSRTTPQFKPLTTQTTPNIWECHSYLGIEILLNNPNDYTLLEPLRRLGNYRSYMILLWFFEIYGESTCENQNFFEICISPVPQGIDRIVVEFQPLRDQTRAPVLIHMAPELTSSTLLN